MEKKIVFGEILSNAFSIGLKNFFSLLGCLVLWILTIWIPYVNVGTTIAIATIPAALSKGNIISPLEIFNKRYYQFMGEFFLVQGLLMMIILPAMLFLIIPAFVMSIAYSLATLLVVDKDKGASEALKISNKLTYGYKWVIFFANLVLALPLPILFYLSLHASMFRIIGFLYFIVFIPIILGAKAFIYQKLSADIQ